VGLFDQEVVDEKMGRGEIEQGNDLTLANAMGLRAMGTSLAHVRFCGCKAREVEAAEVRGKEG